MFYKYAVDPNCYADWEHFQFLRAQFGWNKGRLIAEFPRRKKWIRIAKNLLINDYKLTPEQRKKIEIELQKFSLHKDRFFIRLDYEASDEQGWDLDNAINLSEIFHAIITCKNPTNHDYILIPSELVDNPLWDIDHTNVVDLTPDELCKCVENLLMASPKILFVDPHFKPWEQRWITTLEKFISFATNKRTPILEYHLKIKDEDYIKPDDQRKKEFEKDCRKYIKKILPRGRKITLFRWNTKDHDGDIFHARYVMTEYGGVSFDVGLDSRGNGKTTNVVRLSESTRLIRWNSFQRDSQVYELVDKVEVLGE